MTIDATNPSATPDWAYTEDGYCICCGNGKWKFHMPWCELRDALDVLHLVQDDDQLRDAVKARGVEVKDGYADWQ